MPLYMDFHMDIDITIQAAKLAHLEDLAVQDKYGVKYHQFWVNEEAGIVFCLMEGPSKEACAATHKEANGVTACNIIEVDGGMYSAFMGNGLKVDHEGLVMHWNNMVDTGYRFLLTLDIISLTSLTDSINFDKLKLPEKPKNVASKIIAKYQGREVQRPVIESMVAVFMTPESILQSALSIKKEFAERIADSGQDGWDIKFKMGISVGQPVTEQEPGLFEKALKNSSRLCKIAEESEIVASALLRKLSELCNIEGEKRSFKELAETEEKFVNHLFELIEGQISNPDFGVERLSRDIGISRPQLYRKISAMTGRSPVSFIRDLRMSKALSLIKEKHLNISEIALEVGLSNPSYFSKCFQDKYGISPSKIAG